MQPDGMFDGTVRSHLGTGILLLAAAAALAPGAAGAQLHEPGAVIREAGTELNDEVYYLSASIGYSFSPQMLEALRKGVPLTVELQIEVRRARSYIWDETVAGLQQRYRLSYHALTRQYMIRNLNSGSQHTFPSLEAALSVLGTVVDLPLLDSNLLERDEVYLGRLRAQLDVDELPVPLRVLALILPEWRLSSEWYEWEL